MRTMGQIMAFVGALLLTVSMSMPALVPVQAKDIDQTTVEREIIRLEARNPDVEQSAAQVRYTAVAAGWEHTCALTSSGGVRCWGWGALGDGTGVQSTPADVIGLSSGVAAIAVGDAHSCALMLSGGVKCWGANYNGQLGDGSSMQRLTPVDVSGLTNAVSIDAGADHTCAVTSEGAVKCWGYNAYGQIGDGTTTSQYVPTAVVGLSSGVAAIATGSNHTCARLSTGALKCWGYNWQGQIGDGTRVNRLTPVDVVGLSAGVAAAAAGHLHSCARLATGSIECWGDNSGGQLGDGTGSPHYTPANVAGINDALSVVAGGSHTCAVRQNGLAQCWGNNGAGAIGDGTTIDRWTPTNVQGIGVVSGMAGGMLHTCAVTGSQAIKCWGFDMSGQLGDGALLYTSTPLGVVGLTEGISALGTGEGHTCALTQSGAVRCWGSNGSGELGDGSWHGRTSPVNVIGLPDGMRSVVAGRNHTCALTPTGGVKCWGWNGFGQLGDGTTSSRATPVDVVGLANSVVSLAAGMGHTCALTSAGAVKCWGLNSLGQLGDGSTQNRLTPVDVIGVTSGSSVLAAGALHTCARMATGTIQCWGDNRFGQLGDGTLLQRTTPVAVVGLSGQAAAVTTGSLHTCALLSNHSTQCWGNNDFGQVGDGTTQQRSSPADVVGLLNNAAAIVAGSNHTCAVTSGMAAKCWGQNGGGQLGDGSTQQRNTPVAVLGLSSGTLAVSASTHTCALVTGGRSKCWGGDMDGELGQGRITQRSLPVDVLDASPTVLDVNHTTGAPASFFTITGRGFTPNAQARLDVNGQTISTILTASPTGTFIVFLNTGGADPGGYIVTVSANLAASIDFTIDETQPVWPQEGGGQVLDVPSGIGHTDSSLFLPLISKY